MSKALKKGTKQVLGRQVTANPPSQADFDEVVRLIDVARTRAVAAVNTTLIELYWNIGEYITRKIADEGWGKGTVESLAQHIQRRHPNARSYSASNRWRMSQFFETYRRLPKLAPLVRELSFQFYLEALDRDVKKPHEQPSIGVLLCATKNHEVVEYALSRTMSPALVAEYQTKMPDKKLLQAKLHEFYKLAESRADATGREAIVPQPAAQLPGPKTQRKGSKK